MSGGPATEAAASGAELQGDPAIKLQEEDQQKPLLDKEQEEKGTGVGEMEPPVAEGGGLVPVLEGLDEDEPDLQRDWTHQSLDVSHFLDGTWCRRGHHRSDMKEVSGSHIHWLDGLDHPPCEFEVKDGALHLTLNGEDHVGKVVEDHRDGKDQKVIHWSDGDIWEPRVEEHKAAHELAAKAQTARENACDARILARQALKMDEIAIHKEFKDKAGKGGDTVNFPQFKELLYAHTGPRGKTPNADDMEWILEVLGMDCDAQFDDPSVIFAMVAWHAAQNVPDIVASCVDARVKNDTVISPG